MTISTPSIPDVDSPEAARAGVHAVINMRKRWKLTWAQLARLLGVRSESTLQNWSSRVPETLAPDTLERMGYLMGIYYALEQIRGGERSEQWLHSVNAGNPFFGRSPLEYMLNGRMTDLLETYRYLKGVATGAF